MVYDSRDIKETENIRNFIKLSTDDQDLPTTVISVGGYDFSDFRQGVRLSDPSILEE